MVFLLVVIGCAPETVKGDGDENIDEACSYETGPSLGEVPEAEWPVGMSEAWDAYEAIGTSSEMSLSCDDGGEDVLLSISATEKVAMGQFVFSDLTGPEGCVGHGPASGTMVISIEAGGVASELPADVRLNREDAGVPERVSASSEDSEAGQSWGFRFKDDGSLGYASIHWQGSKLCSWYDEGN